MVGELKLELGFLADSLQLLVWKAVTLEPQALRQSESLTKAEVDLHYEKSSHHHAAFP